MTITTSWFLTNSFQTCLMGKSVVRIKKWRHYNNRWKTSMIRVRFCEMFFPALHIFFVIVSGSSFYILHMKCSKGLQTTVFPIKFSQSPFMVIPRKDRRFFSRLSVKVNWVIMPPPTQVAMENLSTKETCEKTASAQETPSLWQQAR